MVQNNLKIKSDKNRERPIKGEVFRLKANVNKAKKILKWSPSYSGKKGLILGIKKTVSLSSNDENLKIYKPSIYNK